MKWTVILTREDEPNPENTYAAQCLELPGAISCGDGVDQAIEMIKEAIELYLYDEDLSSIPTGEKRINLAELEYRPDYIVIVEVPMPSLVAAA